MTGHLIDASRGAPGNEAAPRRSGGESGAILILALVYIVSVSLIVLALASWATNDLRNTTTFASVSSVQNAASGATKVAIESVRVTPVPANPTQSQLAAMQTVATAPQPCWSSTSGTSNLNFKSGPSTNATINVAVWCSTVENLTSQATRIVTFSTCQLTAALVASANPGAQCAANPLLQAVVAFDDYPPQGAVPFTQQCNISNDGLSCGQGMTLEDWSLNGQLSNTIIITSTAPTSAVVGGPTYTAAATATSQDTVVITTTTPSVCTIASNVVSFVGVGNCTLAFSDVGNSKYGTTQVTQNFSVGNGSQATLYVTSTTGSHAGVTLTTSGGSGSGAVTYTVANGSDSNCTVTGAVLTAATSGTCYVTASKAADANWNATVSAATTVTLS